MPSILLLIEWAHPENRSKRHDHAVSEALANPEFVFQELRPIGGVYDISIVRAQAIVVARNLQTPVSRSGETIYVYARSLTSWNPDCQRVRPTRHGEDQIRRRGGIAISILALWDVRHCLTRVADLCAGLRT